VELLVVLVIFALLAASAVPMLAPLMSNRQVREAARIVSSTLIGARNRAMQSGKPYAVVLDRLNGLPEACVSLAYAEVPPPYSGDSTASNMTVQTAIGPSGATLYFITGLTPNSVPQSTDIAWLGTVKVGDFVRFNSQGTYFQLVPNVITANAGNQQAYDLSTGYYNQDPAPSDSSHYWWQITAPPGVTAIPPVGTNLRYQISRAPMRSAAGGVTLPGSTVIDLNFSGFDQPCQQTTSAGGQLFPYGYTYSFQPIWPRPGVISASAATCPFGSSNANTLTDNSSIVIVFAPSGAIDTVWCWDNTSDAAEGTFTYRSSPTTTNTIASYSIPYPIKPLTPIHLLIGRRELVPLPTSPPPIVSPKNSNFPYDPSDPNFKPYLNWQDLGSLWVSIDHKSGAISTAENNASPTAIQYNGYGYEPGASHGYGSYTEIMESRQLALELQRLGGR
jgi:type II secretory pathway pseudopilin PulG